jgi:hypothetical protein
MINSEIHMKEVAGVAAQLDSNASKVAKRN